jgi:hypothetical protein
MRRAKASPELRGYGRVHRMTRASLAPFVQAGLVSCCRCLRGSVASDGVLNVTFTEVGVGNQSTSFHLRANGDAIYSCADVFWGEIQWGGPSWNTPTQDVTLTPVKGKASGSVSHPMASTSTLSPCPSGLVLDSVSWSNITVTDTTNGSVLAIPDISRTFH